MGIYVNPGNTGFARIAGSNYVDKTGLISLMNERIGGESSLICISRPRRFGKTYAANMLTAYYDCSCDSHELFDGKIISEAADYKTHLNQYNVIYLDISSFISEARATQKPLAEVPRRIMEALRDDLRLVHPELPERKTVNDELLSLIDLPDERPFIFVIDEWDAMIREAKDDENAQVAYLNLLRGWFKNSNFTPKAVAAAYMTGILPIKKDGSQSAISDFNEFSVIKPRKFGSYVGFTEEEVRKLCRQHHADFEIMWSQSHSLQRMG